MKTIYTVKLDIGVRDFATTKEVTKELVLEYIKSVSAPHIYPNIRIETYDCGHKVIVYNDDEYDDCNFTTNVDFSISTLNLF